MEYPYSFEELVECFKLLPGIGKKGAERMVYHVLSMDEDQVKRLSDALINLKKNVDIFVRMNFVIYAKTLLEINLQFVL